MNTPVQSLRPTQADTAQREALLTQLQAQCCNVFGPSISLEAYGSYASGMFLPDSDMDLALVGHADWAGGQQLQELGKRHRENLMRKIADHLEGMRISTGRVRPQALPAMRGCQGPQTASSSRGCNVARW